MLLCEFQECLLYTTLVSLAIWQGPSSKSNPVVDEQPGPPAGMICQKPWISPSLKHYRLSNI